VIRYAAASALLMMSCGAREARPGTRLSSPNEPEAPLVSGRQAQTDAAHANAPLLLPYSSGRIVCDGSPTEAGWEEATRTGDFFAAKTNEPARPLSEARFMSNATDLYLLLYAADQDIREPQQVLSDVALGSFDHFTVQLRRASDPATTFIFEIAPDGSLLDARSDGTNIDLSWTSHAKLGTDADGTPNDAEDEDEEWLIEASLPLRSLGVQTGDTVFVSVERCDTPKGEARACSSWGLDTQGAPSAALTLAKRGS